jgi:hypothetical protein
MIIQHLLLTSVGTIAPALIKAIKGQGLTEVAMEKRLCGEKGGQTST